MLNNDPFYHATIRTMLVVFGSIFKGIKIQRETKRVKVPIVYSDKTDWYTRLQEIPDVNTAKAAEKRITLPRMGFDFQIGGYDYARKLNSVQQRYDFGDGTNPSMMFERSPWVLNFDLFIAVKNGEDGFQIIEQILPFFNPSLTVSVEDSPLATDEATDITFTLGSVTKESDYEGSLPKIRTINWLLKFSSPVYFAGPVSSSGNGFVRKVIVNTYQGLDPDVARRIHRLTVEPNPLTAGPDDDFTYTINDTYFSDAFEVDSETGTDVAEMSSSSSSSSESTNVSSSSSSSSRTSSSSSNSSYSSSSSSS